VGWVTDTVAASGTDGCGLITMLPDAAEVHPASFVTVKEYVFGARPVTVVVVPVP